MVHKVCKQLQFFYSVLERIVRGKQSHGKDLKDLDVSVHTIYVHSYVHNQDLKLTDNMAP